jgi:hypothetical protein
MRGILRLTLAGVWFLGCTPYQQQPAAWHSDKVTGAEQAATAGSPPRPPAARSADELNTLVSTLSQRTHHYTQVAKILLNQLLIDNRGGGTPTSSWRNKSST